MGRIATIARRTFLIGSAAVLGGVAFGYYMYRRPPENPLEDDLAEGTAALTPYVLINADGITLITPRTDLGQGAYSLQAALIAEELDVDIHKVNIDPGPPSPAYYNTALSHEAVPFASTDDGITATVARGLADATLKFIGLQITGGSTTASDSYEKLRIAGAVARETLKQAAFIHTGNSIPVDQMWTRDGRVMLSQTGGDGIPYESLAEIAATIEPVDRVDLKPKSEWRYLGKAMERIDIVAKSTGRQKYGIDLQIEGMVHATVRSNPRQGGRMGSFDAAKAEGMPGVRKIVPLENAVGVIADNTWAAFRAADAIVFDWGGAPFPHEQEDHWQALADSFTEGSLDSRNRDDGNIDDARASGEIVEAEYRAPYLAHAPLEPVSAIVLAEEDRLEIWTGTQIPGFLVDKAAKLADVSEENVTLHVQMVGGSFGHRLEDDYVMKTVELALAMKGTPVKMTYSREEDMRHDFPRQIAMARGRGAFLDRRINALDLSIAMPAVTASQMRRQGLNLPGPDPVIVAGAWDQPYGIENYRVTGYMADNLAPVSSWRSVGASTNSFFHESFLDELIHAAGADPLEERLRLLSHEPSRRVLEVVGGMADWGSDPGPNKGRGIAYTLAFGTPVAEVVEVTATQEGIRIDRVWAAAEIGTLLDPLNFENQVKGGIVWGLGHAMNCETTFTDGMVQQTNFHAFKAMRIYQCPEIEVRGLENGSRVTGIGEPPVAAAAPALANAIFAATGKRIREMPFNKHVSFV